MTSSPVDATSPVPGRVCRRSLLAAAVGAVAVPAGAAAGRLGLLVPAYFYPSAAGRELWRKLEVAARTVPLIAIANPASGPGARRDPAYTETLDAAHRAGVQLIGYVSTSYARRTRAEVATDLGKWKELYPMVRGVFFDEQSSGADQVAHYRALAADARRTFPRGRVVTNPGTLCDEAYVRGRAADIACIFEHHTGADEFRAPTWAARYGAGRFAALPYATPDEVSMRQRLASFAGQGIGWLYITDDSGANPWDTLPAYWAGLVAEVMERNRTGAGSRGRWAQKTA